MKKIISIFLCLVMALSLSVVAFASDSKEEVTPLGLITWYINADGVNLRESEGGVSIGLVYNGDTFTNGGVSTYQANGIAWRHCSMTSGQNSGRTGYVAKNYTSWKLF